MSGKTLSLFVKERKKMLYQLHWQYKDKSTDVKAQKDINSHDEMRAFIEETIEAFSLPDGAVWLACNEKSSLFVLATSKVLSVISKEVPELLEN